MGCNLFQETNKSEIDLIRSIKNEINVTNQSSYKNFIYSNEINNKKVEVELIYSENLLFNNSYLSNIIFRIIAKDEKIEIKLNLSEDNENIFDKRISLKNIIYSNKFKNKINKVKLALKENNEIKPNKTIYLRKKFEEKKIESKYENNINYEFKGKKTNFFNNLKNMRYYNAFNGSKNNCKNFLNDLRKTSLIKSIFNINENKENTKSKEKEIQFKSSFNNIRSKYHKSIIFYKSIIFN